jgi:hypothetical protein
VAKRALSPELGRAVNAAGPPLAALIEDALAQAEGLIVATQTRKSFWTRLFDSAARGNPLARHLAQQEESWLAAHEAETAVLHGTVRALALYLKGEGRL